MVDNSLASAFPLSCEQIEKFLEDGYLVVDNVLSQEEIDEVKASLSLMLQSKYSVDTQNLKETAHNLKTLSSTNGSGGILDIFYPPWKLKLCENEKMVAILSQLWAAGFRNHEREWSSEENEGCTEDFRDHHFGPFDVNRAYMYIDRICYRIPSDLSKEIGKQLNSVGRKWPLQRSLTPHLDCCPAALLESPKEISKWRPIQSFISLTDNLKENTGGFECVKGFHKQFNDWAKNRQPTTGKGGIKYPPPCVGEFTPIRPKEDCDVLKSVEHIPCKAGSFVVWDNRIPHANSRHNNASFPRIAVYASFLPDVDINRKYVKVQLEKYLCRKISIDQWVERDESSLEMEEDYQFSPLGRKLIGIDDW